MLYWYNYSISSFYFLLLTIEHKDAFAFYESPCLASVVMDLIADVLAFLECDALGERVTAILIEAVIKDSIGAPASFFVHRAWGEVFYQLLDLF